jgi:hypothetical protein
VRILQRIDQGLLMTAPIAARDVAAAVILLGQLAVWLGFF